MMDLKALSDAACAGPWLYRPDQHDDWGTIRGAEIEINNIGPINPPVAKSNAAWDQLDNFDAHRMAKTDPMEPNGRFIVDLVNAYRAGDLVDATQARDYIVEIELEAGKSNGTKERILEITCTAMGGDV
jgi:hypothetical protein